MKNSPVVTIYITNYNYAKYIQQSIESVLKQTYKDYELIIIDDGSTDNSKEIIEQYREYPNVRIVYQKNKGLNITNNIAMRLASGQYLVRLDADDYWDIEYLEKVVEKMESDPEIGLVFPDYYYVDSDGKMTGVEKRFNFEEEVTLYDLPAHGACTLIRLEFLRRLGGYNESFACQDGYDLWLKFISSHKVANVNTPLFYYRRHGNNLTTNEERILSTRKRIKQTFLEDHIGDIPKTVAIIPIRSNYIGKENWPLFQVDHQTVVEKKVAMLERVKGIEKIVVTSSEKVLLETLTDLFKDNSRVVISERPSSSSQYNESLVATHQYLLSKYAYDFDDIKHVLTVSLEYPLVKEDTVEELINTMVIFGADATISVRPNSQMHYQHTGNGLQPILNQERFTKLEREALYTGSGGLILTNKEMLIRQNKLIVGRISHVIVEEKAALCINSAFNFEIYKMLIGTGDKL
ncbi:MAG: glycosyltransferase [Clostridia bacterium]|nr:glycosyltransferase [Clostridia bacterium]